ncbi:Carboxymuconolactone decarboxylase family protein [Streptomyces sp. YIM 130001]|uniref:carboxymuconolactone decarboxylase family protein n=1 Tax=Streptomyces sp. YIM 130001 TaxID=2259644 RepID=UPI000E65960E|nr:carboxymuconolactone decarboxylase family protein [Streptomyces sp. YIM 130001]RII21005.1 Carboxymuconolactone decarboxylase family protein [Streptomyces sp. YIM 130001]
MRPARMRNPGALLPEATKGILQVVNALQQDDSLPPSILGLVHLRASQINGCGFCVEGGVRSAKETGESDERLHAVAAWRESPRFTDEERAALALAECATRLSDRSDPVPDDVWDEAATYFDEKQLARIVLWTAVTNLFNRINVTTRQPAGEITW